MSYAFFDFDGTISSRDSFLRFLYFTDSRRFLVTVFAHLPQIVWYVVGRYPNHRLKEAFLQGVLNGRSMYELEQLAERYCATTLSALIRPLFWPRLAYHRSQKDTVVVVTATPRFILEPWCATHKLAIIGTELQLDQNGWVNGKIAGKNCMGEEKVSRIHERYALDEQSVVYCYGDSGGDWPMLALAEPDRRYYRPFR